MTKKRKRRARPRRRKAATCVNCKLKEPFAEEDLVQMAREKHVTCLDCGVPFRRLRKGARIYVGTKADAGEHRAHHEKGGKKGGEAKDKKDKVCCDVCGNESPFFFDDLVKQARGEAVCSDCGVPIEKGQALRARLGPREGSPVRRAKCLDCGEIVDLSTSSWESSTSSGPRRRGGTKPHVNAVLPMEEYLKRRRRKRFSDWEKKREPIPKFLQKRIRQVALEYDTDDERETDKEMETETRPHKHHVVNTQKTDEKVVGPTRAEQQLREETSQAEKSSARQETPSFLSDESIAAEFGGWLSSLTVQGGKARLALDTSDAAPRSPSPTAASSRSSSQQRKNVRRPQEPPRHHLHHPKGGGHGTRKDAETTAPGRAKSPTAAAKRKPRIPKPTKKFVLLPECCDVPLCPTSGLNLPAAATRLGTEVKRQLGQSPPQAAESSPGGAKVQAGPPGPPPNTTLNANQGGQGGGAGQSENRSMDSYQSDQTATHEGMTSGEKSALTKGTVIMYVTYSILFIIFVFLAFVLAMGLKRTLAIMGCGGAEPTEDGLCDKWGKCSISGSRICVKDLAIAWVVASILLHFVTVFTS